MTKGRMQRVAFRNKPRMSRYEVECGAHGCVTVQTVVDPADAKQKGWLRVDGYGWICPKCQEGNSLPSDYVVIYDAETQKEVRRVEVTNPSSTKLNKVFDGLNRKLDHERFYLAIKYGDPTKYGQGSSA